MSATAASERVLADYTAPALIILRFQGRTTSAVMEELSHVLQQDDPSLSDLRVHSRAALEQELLTSPTLEFGAVLPRVRVPGLGHPRLALGRPVEPFHWLAKAYPPSKLIFLVAEPEADALESEQLAETLTRLAKDRLRLNELGLARTAEEMLMLLGRLPLVSAEECARVQALRTQRVSYYAARNVTRRQASRI